MATASGPPYLRSRVVAESLVALVGIALLAWAWRADLRWCERHLLMWFWAYDASQVAIARRWRTAGVVAGLAVLLVVRPLVGRAAARRPPAEALGSALRLGLALVLSLVASELGLRVLKLPKGEVLRERDPGSHRQKHPRHGWRYTPSRSNEIPSADGRTIEYAVNAEEGNRAASVTL